MRQRENKYILLFVKYHQVSIYSESKVSVYTKVFVSKVAGNTDHDDTWYIINPHGRFLLARGDRKRSSYISVKLIGNQCPSNRRARRRDAGRLPRSTRGCWRKEDLRFSSFPGRLNYEKSFSTSFLRTVLLINLCPLEHEYHSEL